MLREKNVHTPLVFRCSSCHSAANFQSFSLVSHEITTFQQLLQEQLRAIPAQTGVLSLKAAVFASVPGLIQDILLPEAKQRMALSPYPNQGTQE